MLRYLKLSTGDELIGRIDDDETGYDLRILKHPWRLVCTSQGYIPMPMPASNLTINNVHVIFEGDVDDELARVYNERTGGVVTPHKSLMI